jgi:hypothetical protein
MRFYIPGITDAVEALNSYEAARNHCEKEMNWITEKSRIYSLRYRHNGHEYLAQVGAEDNTEGLVICIFETSEAFLICTPDRGFIRGSPLVVGISEVSDLEDFEA